MGSPNASFLRGLRRFVWDRFRERRDRLGDVLDLGAIYNRIK